MPSDITYGELLNAVAKYLGYQTESDPYTPTVWSTAEEDEVKDIVKRGYRQFLYPPSLRNDGVGHTWSFLKPTRSLYVWATGAGGTLSSAVHSGGYTTLTATASVFYETMEKKTLTFTTSGNSYTVYSYTSATVVVLSGNASAETGAFTVATAGSYTMPADFAGVIGDVTYTSTSISRVIPVVADGMLLRRMEVIGSSSGYPEMIAIRPSDATGTIPQRFELVTAPTSDAAYQLTYRSAINPRDLSSTYLYPLGGAQHSETVLASCIAMAELSSNDEIGVRNANFRDRLAASISQDKMLSSSPDRLGYNGDPRARSSWPAFSRNPYVLPATYTP